MNPKFIPASILVAALLIATAFFYTIESSYVAGMSVVEGKVGRNYDYGQERYGKRSYDTRTEVSYVVGNKEYTVVSRAIRLFEFDDTVDVYYDPNFFSRARIKRLDEAYFFTLIFLFFSMISIFLGAINYFLVNAFRNRADH